MQYRQGEQGGTYFRTERIFRIDNVWYFSTREGCNIGPYNTRDATEKGLKCFLDCMTSGESFKHDINYAMQTARQAQWEYSVLY